MTDPVFDVLLDSGAYSAYMSGKPINLDDYIAFCHEWKKYLWGYAALDVIKDPKATLQNWKEMRRQGLNPIPIHTVGHKKKTMDRMFEQSKLVMLGGIFGGQKDNRQAIKLRHKWAGGRPVHWLGYSRMDMMQTFMPFSVDSTNWKSGMIHGHVAVYLGSGNWERITHKQCREGKPVSKQFLRICETCGFSRRDLRDEELWNITKKVGWRRSIPTQLSVYSWVQFSLEYYERFGTRYFLAGWGADPRSPDAIAYWARHFTGYNLKEKEDAKQSKIPW